MRDLMYLISVEGGDGSDSNLNITLKLGMFILR